MKNTLRFSLIAIGGVFFGIAFVNFIRGGFSIDPRQNLGMAGVGILFIVAGWAMDKR